MPRVLISAQGAAEEIAAAQQQLQELRRSLGTVGMPKPGCSPRDAIATTNEYTLFRYRPDQTAARGEPLLIVYALVNRPEMADLEPGRSLVADLLSEGYDVFLIEWADPDLIDSERGLADYVNRYLDQCVRAVLRQAGVESLNLLGICQGGTFAVCYAAQHPDLVRRLVTTVTPIDFHTQDDALSRIVRDIDLDALVRVLGNVPAGMLNPLFLYLKPYRLMLQKYLGLLEAADDPERVATFLRMEQWIFDSPAIAGRACLEFARDLYQKNLLARGELVIGGARIDLDQLTMPILNIFARDDHLVPPAASRALAGLVKSAAYAEHELAGGHIGVYVGSRNRRAVATVVRDWAESAAGTPARGA